MSIFFNCSLILKKGAFLVIILCSNEEIRLKMKCLFIYNTKSGKGKITKCIGYIVKKLKTVYDVVDVHESESVDDLKNHIKEGSNLYDAIIFNGGDGSFNDVASGISECENRPTLGYIPTGTTNDIAHNLKIPTNIKKAVKVITDQVSIKHDVGKVNDDYFMYVLAIGAGSATSYTTKQKIKRVLGKMGYLHDFFDEFSSRELIDVKLTDGNTTIEKRVPLMLIMNSRRVAGMWLNPYKKVSDGQFDVMMVNDGKMKGRINIILTFILRIFRWRKYPAMDYTGSSFDVEVSDNDTWCVDGERGPHGKIHVENLHDHLTIFVPKHLKKS